MPVNSSTSSSERTFVRVAAVTFALLLAVMTVSYERLVRTAEARYGLKQSSLIPPRSSKVDALVRNLRDGERYSAYAIGTSRTEEDLRSDVLAEEVGPTFNLGMGGSSLLSGFEILDLLDARPSLIIAGVSPMDFTALALQQGSGVVRRGRDSIASLRQPKSEERGPAAAARTAAYTLLHGAAPQRKRNLGQWRERFERHGDLLQFLNTADAAVRNDDLWIHGFLGVPRVATAETYAMLRPTTTPAEYLEEHEPLYARLQEAVARQRNRGTDVVFVRLPVTPIPRSLEDAAGFDRDIRAASARCGVRYIDGNLLAGDAFIRDRRNFVDGGHLNVSGATAFSRLLATALRQPGTAERQQVSRFAGPPS